MVHVRSSGTFAKRSGWSGSTASLHWSCELDPLPLTQALENKATPLFWRKLVSPAVYNVVQCVIQEAVKKHLSASGTNRLLLLHKQAHDKRSIAESLEAYINRARLSVCEVFFFFFLRNIATLEVHISISFQYFSRENIPPTPPFEELLSLLPMGVFSRDCSDTLCLCTWEGSGTVVCTPWYPVLHVQWSHVLGGGCLSF